MNRLSTTLLVLLSSAGFLFAAADQTSLQLAAKDAKLSGAITYNTKVMNIGYWTQVGASCTWAIPDLKPGSYKVSVEYAIAPESAGGRFDISTESNKKEITSILPTGGWNTYKVRSLVPIQIGAGDKTLTFTATKILPQQSLMNLKTVTLTKAQ